MLNDLSWLRVAVFLAASFTASGRSRDALLADTGPAGGQVGIRVVVLQRWFIDQCGTIDESRQLVQEELEHQGFQVVDLPTNPRNGQVRVDISAVRYEEEIAAYSVVVELRERAQLERDPKSPATAVTWSQSRLGIGKTASVCSNVRQALKQLTAILAKERQTASSGMVGEQQGR